MDVVEQYVTITSWSRGPDLNYESDDLLFSWNIFISISQSKFCINSQNVSTTIYFRIFSIHYSLANMQSVTKCKKGKKVAKQITSSIWKQNILHAPEDGHVGQNI
jgi:hypothetical protein